MSLSVRTWIEFCQEIHDDDGDRQTPPLRKAAAVAVIRNPYAGRFAQDLDDLIAPSGELAEQLVSRATEVLRVPAESCGKGAIVGVAGEQEHGVACLTTPFGDAMRAGIDGSTWVTSTTKVAAAGASIDIPLAHKRALMVRAFYDTVTVMVPDGPRPDEIAVIAAVASGGRIHERVGGLTLADATVGDGLR